MYSRPQLEKDFKNLLESVRLTRFDFARTELDIALTFCRLAADAERFSERRMRNVQNALKAYRGGITAARTLVLSLTEQAELKRLEAEVKAAVQRLDAQR